MTRLVFTCIFLLVIVPYVAASSVKSVAEQVMDANRIMYSRLGSGSIMSGTETDQEADTLDLELDPILECSYPEIKSAFLEACGQNPDVQPSDNRIRPKRLVGLIVFGAVVLTLSIAASLTVSAGVVVYMHGENEALKKEMEVERNATKAIFASLKGWEKKYACEVGGSKVFFETFQFSKIDHLISDATGLSETFPRAKWTYLFRHDWFISGRWCIQDAAL